MIEQQRLDINSDADHYYLSYVQPLFGGTVGVSWIQIGLGSIAQTSSEVSSNNEVVNLSMFSYFSNAFLFSYGREIVDNLSFGLTAKYITSDMTQIQGGQAYGYSITPGILYKVLPGWTLGVKVDEILNEQSWGTGMIEKVPPKLRLGVACDAAKIGLFAVDLSQILDSGYSTEAAAGYEWSRNGLSIRVGYGSDSLSAGAGFEVDNISLDYAYVKQTALSQDNVHRVSLSGKW
ncbi:MAG: hypothetical protein KKB81_02295 [Candidatus Margulisbacteria bacterium]|nr:hypothetical protein [Candidatus Margulisiibacteriota bacterium]MBU1021810.1 hypothetical protein [Candidatus Margulisiibacteriota bacterium]MBU1729610.1 hypothetical protein [Candidatus Margulisiibacteriota bacterium]